eukprot:jgi/Ulvmu1/11261/UM073_0033.1
MPYRLKAYDHMLLVHILHGVDMLMKLGFAPVNTSSRFNEAGNKDSKAQFKRLPGGGVPRDNWSHLTVVQVMRHLYARYKMERLAEYEMLGQELAQQLPERDSGAEP